MERKELKPIDVDEADIVLSCYSYVYPADKADAVMDGYEERIKELEERIAHTNYINKTLGEGLKDREARIKELEKKLKEIK